MSLPPSNAAALDLTVLVACYNEEQHILATLENLVAALVEAGLSWEVIVLDDASQDRSVELVEEFLSSHPALPISLWVNQVNQGFGYNYVQGAYLGRGEYYRVVCGDDCEPAETLLKIFQQLGAADVVIPYPLGDDGRGRFRRAISKLFTSLINLVSGHRLQYYNGMALVRRFHVMRWHGNYRGFGVQADLVARLLDEDLSYVEVGVAKRERKHGHSTALKLKNVLSVLHTIADIGVRRLGHLLYPRDFAKDRRLACRSAAAPQEHVEWILNSCQASAARPHVPDR